MLELWPRPFRGFLHRRGIAMGTEVSGCDIIPTVTVCDCQGRKMNFTNSRTLVGGSLSRPTETQASRLLALLFMFFFFFAFLFIYFRTKNIKEIKKSKRKKQI